MTEQPHNLEDQSDETQPLLDNEQDGDDAVVEQSDALDIEAQVQADLEAMKNAADGVEGDAIEQIEFVAETKEIVEEEVVEEVEEEILIDKIEEVKEDKKIGDIIKEEAPQVEEVAPAYIPQATQKSPVVEFDVPQTEVATKKSSGKIGRIIEILKDFVMASSTWKNIGVWIGFLAFAFFLLTMYLSVYTRHGESTVVADFKGKDVKEAKAIASDAGFNLVVSDSIYDINIPEGIIFEQFPSPESAVKEGRTIYVKCGGKPAKLRLPTFEGNYNYTNYSKRLSFAPYNIRTGMVKEKKFDAILEENTILKILHGDKEITEKDLKKGVEIEQGDTLSFVVSTRISEFVPIPNLVCKTYSEASFLLTSSSLVLGEVDGEVENKSSAYVWKQYPSYKPGKTVTRGTKVELYLQTAVPDDCQ